MNKKLYVDSDSTMVTVVREARGDELGVEISEADYYLFKAAEAAYDGWLEKFDRMKAVIVAEQMDRELIDLQTKPVRTRPRGLQS